MNIIRKHMYVLISMVGFYGLTSCTSEHSPNDLGAPASQPDIDVPGPTAKSPAPAEQNKAIDLTSGQALSYKIESFSAGEISSVKVFIGNYMNTSDGSMQVKLCQLERCTITTVPLAGSKDNEYLSVVFTSALPVVDDGHPLNVELSKLGGKIPLAVWGYPTGAMSAQLMREDGKPTGFSPKLEIGYLTKP